MEVQAFKYIGAGLATMGMIGAAIGVGHIFSGLMGGIARNPSVEGKLFQRAIIGAGLSEALGILAFVVSMMILFL
ncbi:MAG: F0F1 ATP synthase subunit C [Rickettsiales bacterium]